MHAVLNLKYGSTLRNVTKCGSQYVEEEPIINKDKNINIFEVFWQDLFNEDIAYKDGVYILKILILIVSMPIYHIDVVSNYVCIGYFIKKREIERDLISIQ
jgi:hypothetical protein